MKNQISPNTRKSALPFSFFFRNENDYLEQTRRKSAKLDAKNPFSMIDRRAKLCVDGKSLFSDPFAQTIFSGESPDKTFSFIRLRRRPRSCFATRANLLRVIKPPCNFSSIFWFSSSRQFLYDVATFCPRRPINPKLRNDELSRRELRSNAKQAFLFRGTSPSSSLFFFTFIFRPSFITTRALSLSARSMLHRDDAVLQKWLGVRRT